MCSMSLPSPPWLPWLSIYVWTRCISKPKDPWPGLMSMLEVTPWVIGEAANVASLASRYDSSSSSIAPSFTDWILNLNDFCSPGVDSINSHLLDSLIDLLVAVNVFMVFTLLPGIRWTSRAKVSSSSMFLVSNICYALLLVVYLGSATVFGFEMDPFLEDLDLEYGLMPPEDAPILPSSRSSSSRLYVPKVSSYLNLLFRWILDLILLFKVCGCLVLASLSPLSFTREISLYSELRPFVFSAGPFTSSVSTSFWFDEDIGFR